MFSYFEKVIGTFPSRSLNIFSNNGLLKHIFAFVLMRMCACYNEHMREVNNYVFCPLCMVCPGSAVSWNHQDCNRQSIRRVQKIWLFGTGLCLNARTQV